MSEILDISTEQERPQVRIDDVLYDLMLPTDLTLKDMIWLQKAAKKIDSLQKKLEADNVSDAVASEFQATITRFSTIILGEVPENIRNKLTDIQRMSIVDVYAKLIEEQHARFFETGVTLSEKEKVGSTSSPNSNGSTEETSEAG